MCRDVTVVPRWFLLFAYLCASVAFSARRVSAAPPRAGAAGDEGVWTEVARADMDTRALSDRGRKALEMSGVEWKHAQTDHFVIHYEQAIFARKVARMAEFYYSYIGEDLKGAKDRIDGRSHIFIYRNPKRWEEMRKNVGDIPEWTFAQVSGTMMLLQQADDTSRSGDVLAHEMTHLIVNRLFTGRLPIWLNEGIAEYYEEFAYSAMKGIKKSKRAQFQRLRREFPLSELFGASSYPADTKDVYRFYETSKFMVGFLLLGQDQGKFLPFMEDMLKGSEVVDAFAKHYGLASMDEIEKAFRKFAY